MKFQSCLAPVAIGILSMALGSACSGDDYDVLAGAGSGGTTPAAGGSGEGASASGGAASGGISAGGTLSGGASTGGSGSGAAAGSSGDDCVDVYPYDDGYSCEEQAGFGKCGEDWLVDYCDLSCGRCGELAGANCGETPDPPTLDGDAGAAPPLECSTAPADDCPFPGLMHACRDRFALGINYAWRNFGTDFGGLAAWNLEGVAATPDAYNQDLARMKQNGAGVIRWWMFPDFRGDGVVFEAGVPVALTESTVSDIHMALELAQRNDVYLVPTIFSFDGFRPTRTEGENAAVEVPGISALVESETGRASLVDMIVTPIAEAFASSPYASRLLGWDVINEPEWAIEPTGTAPNGGDFTPNEELDTVPLSDMVAFINASLVALFEATPHAKRSVGWAAAKWAWAFQDVVDVEFNQPHIYSWVNDYWPYTTPPAELGYPERPVVMGEFYLLDGPFGETPNFDTVMTSWYDAGYAGAWPWQYYDGCISMPGSEGVDLTLIAAFADSKGCSVSY